MFGKSSCAPGVTASVLKVCIEFVQVATKWLAIGYILMKLRHDASVNRTSSFSAEPWVFLQNSLGELESNVACMWQEDKERMV
jgi:hypothetical protein